MIRFPLTQFCLSVLITLGISVPAIAAAPAALAPHTHEDVGATLSSLVKERFFDPNFSGSEAYRAIERDVLAVTAQKLNHEKLVAGLNTAWQNAPVSHIHFSLAHGNAEQTAAYLDSFNVGGGGAQLHWQSDVAVLTVNTMMGLDTIAEIEQAYLELTQKRASALIIDLRANEGGTFASRAIISHVLQTLLDAGVFVSRSWFSQHTYPTTTKDVVKLTPWNSWSLKAFWADVQSQALTRIQIQPSAPIFTGKVLVLISRRTASAAELTAVALRASGRAQLIGESTAGKMLSQAPFDLAHDVQMFLPVADYYAAHSGRIEGRGVQPDIHVAATDALAYALTLLS